MTPRVSFLSCLRAVVAEQPDRVAILSQGTQALTYAEVYRRAAILGDTLRERGVKPGQLLGLLLGRSADHVICLLGTWFAGAAFLPLDPGLPRQRLAFMVRDAGLRLVVARDAGPLDGSGVDIIPPPDAAPLASLPPAPQARAEDLAYVIYTSGATGVPKGVMVPHRGLVNLLQAQIRAFGMGPDERSLFYLSPSFDASISDIGTALLSGATLCIETDEVLPRVLRDRRITHVDLPPALLKVLDPLALPATLSTLIIGGEACPPPIVRRFAERVRVINVYGPTEATICTSLCACDATRWDRPLIGRPVPNVSLHLFDDQLQPVKKGTPAELYIGGAGLALGYLNRPDLTAQKFLTRAGERLYRTGDLVMEREDGEIEFLGRIDRQIKLRGLLIEPEEIEAQLLLHPGVQRACVVKRSTGLVAFILRHHGVQVSPSALREHLSRTLPRWMLPRHYEFLDRMPLTVAGKIDLMALPAGTMDDFFAQGGDSLTALEMLARAEAQGVHLSLPGEAMDCDVLRADVAGLLAPRTGPSRIFLTGATGFFGARLLAELLERTDAGICCLVRAGDPGEGEARILGALRAHGVTPHPGRIQVLCGELSHPRFGWTDSQWQQVAETTSSVYHCAATVNMVLPYSELRGSNVVGTAEILRLVRAGQSKHLHHVSTLSVFVGTDRNTGMMTEADDLRDTKTVHGGYAQSKWAAEHLLRSAPAATGPISYYRLGLITGDSRTGYCSPTDQLGMFVRGIAKLGCIPMGMRPDLKVDVTPVDYAAPALAFLSLRPEQNARTYHIANQRSLSLAELIFAMRSFGVAIAEVPETEFQARLRQLEGGSPEEAVTCLSLGHHRSLDLFQATQAHFDTRNTQAGLRGSGLSCPPPDQSLLHTYLHHILRHGKTP